MVRFVDTVFYLLEYSELFFFLSMFQFNWITTPLGDGSTLSNVCLAWVFFFLVLFFFFFCCCKLCYVFDQSFYWIIIKNQIRKVME